jgi:hypothetical protein
MINSHAFAYINVGYHNSMTQHVRADSSTRHCGDDDYTMSLPHPPPPAPRCADFLPPPHLRPSLRIFPPASPSRAPAPPLPPPLPPPLTAHIPFPHPTLAHLLRPPCPLGCLLPSN